MRSRAEVLNETSADTKGEQDRARMIELLLDVRDLAIDIRDLLQRFQPPIIISTDAPESPVSAVNPDTSKK